MEDYVLVPVLDNTYEYAWDNEYYFYYFLKLRRNLKSRPRCTVLLGGLRKKPF